ncbi:MAG: hypothetical protein HKP19_04185 [Xanthomonadales bacterium]|nr:hypothetical protein [Xanthomonadales bacterium]
MSDCRMSEVEVHKPQLVFMHIAKTAGTRVNAYFDAQFPDGETATHVESNPLWRSEPNWGATLKFVSGHIVFSEFDERLDLSKCVFVTLVREPYAHLRSHFAWIRHLTAPELEAHLRTYPQYIQNLAVKLRDTDFTSSENLFRLVSSLEGLELHLLENCQTRYFAAPLEQSRVDEHAYSAAKQRLGRVDVLGLTEETDWFLSKVATRMGFDPPETGKKHNISNSYYGLDITGEECRSVLLPLIEYDLKLYRTAKEITSSAPRA